MEVITLFCSVLQIPNWNTAVKYTSTKMITRR